MIDTDEEPLDSADECQDGMCAIPHRSKYIADLQSSTVVSATTPKSDNG
jgi:hypothetical protein